MSHFAKIENGIVVQVIVADQSFINAEHLGPKENWVKTSYNTHKGQHSRGKPPVRKNYAAIGMVYDSVKDFFHHPKASFFPSWVMNDEIGEYEAPIPIPQNGKEHLWNENTLSWDVDPRESE